MGRAALDIIIIALVLGHSFAVQIRHMHAGEASLQTSARRSAVNRSVASAVGIADMFELVNIAAEVDNNQTLGAVGGSAEGSSENSLRVMKKNKAELQVVKQNDAKDVSNASRLFVHSGVSSHWSWGAEGKGNPAWEVVALAEAIGESGFWALSGKENSAGVWLGGAVLLCILMPILSMIFAMCLGEVVKTSIESLDQRVIGVDVEIGRLSINPFQAYILVENVVINNPTGYEAPYLMKIDKVYVNLDASMLCCSFFKHIVVDDLVFTGLDVIYAKKLLTSNFNDVIGFMELKKSDDEMNKDNDEPKKGSASAMQITLRRVLVEDVGMKMEAEIGGGMGPRVEVGNMDYANFSEEVGGSGAVLSTAVSLLMRTILKSAVVTTMGKGAVTKFSEMSFLKSAEGAEEKAMNAVGSIASHLKAAETSAVETAKTSASGWFRNPLVSSGSAPAAVEASPGGSEQRSSGSWFRNPLARRNSA